MKNKFIRSYRDKYLYKILENASASHKVAQAIDVEYKLESIFQTSQGEVLPIYKGYRYSLINGMGYIPEIALFRQLHDSNILNEQEKKYYTSCIGTRTLMYPIEEVRNYLLSVVDRLNANIVFHKNNHITGIPTLLPDDETIKNNINRFVDINNNTFNHTQKRLPTFTIKKGMKILEIGFSSGGYSIFALEKMGFKVTGLDNAYGDIMDLPIVHTHIKEKIKSDCDFVFADITNQTPFNDNEFDIIYSASVLEHITALPKAFKEMKRILKPNGVIIHRYNPFFAPNGGHNWGCLDCPWGHTQLPFADFERYLKECRPHEAEFANFWIKNTLNRASISEVQEYLSLANFKPLLWEMSSEHSKHISNFNPNVFLRTLKNYPRITLSDLISRDIYFVAAESKI